MRQKKTTRSFIFFCIVLMSAFNAQARAETPSKFALVKQAVFSEPYEVLPQYDVHKSLFGPKKGANNHLLDAARRTLELEDDLFEFPQGQKLLQANGICFAGAWKMYPVSPFTGLYQPSTEIPMIARVSVSLGGTRQKDKRAMGMAIKLFPPERDASSYRTYNVFLMHNMAGVRTKHVLDLDMDNEPPVGGLPGLSNLGTALRLLKDLETADKERSGGQANARFRPVSHLAAHAVPGKVVAPKWLRVSVDKNIPRISMDDFRDELRLGNYPGHKLAWLIEAAHSSDRGKAGAEWQKIGQLEFTESITSSACDRMLHFKHPTLQK